MIILGLVLVLFAIGIYMTAENVMIKPFGFIIGITGLYIILKYRPKNEGLRRKGRDVVD
jgi:hypothetical protein